MAESQSNCIDTSWTTSLNSAVWVVPNSTTCRSRCKTSQGIHSHSNVGLHLVAMLALHLVMWRCTLKCDTSSEVFKSLAGERAVLPTVAGRRCLAREIDGRKAGSLTRNVQSDAESHIPCVRFLHKLLLSCEKRARCESLGQQRPGGRHFGTHLSL